MIAAMKMVNDYQTIQIVFCIQRLRFVTRFNKPMTHWLIDWVWNIANARRKFRWLIGLVTLLRWNWYFGKVYSLQTHYLWWSVKHESEPPRAPKYKVKSRDKIYIIFCPPATSLLVADRVTQERQWETEMESKRVTRLRLRPLDVPTFVARPPTHEIRRPTSLTA